MREYENLDPLLMRAFEGRILKKEERLDLYNRLNTDETFGECFYDMLKSYCATPEYELNRKILGVLAIFVVSTVSVKLTSMGIGTQDFINYLLKVWIPTTLASGILYELSKYVIPTLLVYKDLYKFRLLFNQAEDTTEGIENDKLYRKLISGLISEMKKDIYIIEHLRYQGYMYDVKRIEELINKYQNLLDFYDFSYSENTYDKYSNLNNEMLRVLGEISDKCESTYGDKYIELYKKYNEEYDKKQEKELIKK